MMFSVISIIAAIVAAIVAALIAALLHPYFVQYRTKYPHSGSFQLLFDRLNQRPLAMPWATTRIAPSQCFAITAASIAAPIGAQSSNT